MDSKPKIDLKKHYLFIINSLKKDGKKDITFNDAFDMVIR